MPHTHHGLKPAAPRERPPTQTSHAAIQDPKSSCKASFENTDAGTHGWLGNRSDYGLGVGLIDCLNLRNDPASITVHAEIAATRGVGFAGSVPDGDTNVCVANRKCSTRRIESNGGPNFDGETCFTWLTQGTTTLESDATGRAVDPASDVICAQ